MKFLKILLFFLPALLFSCSSEDAQNYHNNSGFSPHKFGEKKYQRIFNSLYIRIALDKQQPNQALDLFIRDIHDMNDMKLFKKVSEEAISQYRFSDALLISKAWNEIESTPESLKMGLVSSLETGDFDSARKYFRNYSEITNTSSKLDYSKLFFYLVDNKNRINVINFFEEELNDNFSRDFAVAFIELIYSYNMSLEVINLIEKIQSNNERNLVRLYASSLIQIGDYDSAEEALKSYLSGKELVDKQVYLELLEIYLIENRIDEIDDIVNSILRISPNDSEILFELSRILFDNGYYDLSEKYLASLVVNNDRIEFLRGMLDQKKGNYNESIAHFDRIEDYNFKVPAIINSASSILQMSGEKEAINYLLTAKDDINEYNDQVRVLLKVISILRMSESFNKIIDIASEHLKNNPKDINILYARAMGYESLKNINAMELDLLKILEFDKKNTNTLNALGYSLTIHTSRYEDASNYVMEAYTHDPGNAAIIDSMSWILYKQGKYSEALKYSEIAYLKDKDPEIIEHHCKILLKNSLFNEFDNILKSIKNSGNYNDDLIEKLISLKDDVSI